MLFERHLGQERSLSSPFTTGSRYSCPHIMQRNVSIVVSAILPSWATATTQTRVAASGLGRWCLDHRLGSSDRGSFPWLCLQRLPRVLDFVPGNSTAQLLHLVHDLGELLPLRGGDPLELQPLWSHTRFFKLVPQPLDTLDGLAVGVDVVAVGVVTPRDQDHRCTAAEPLQHHLLRDACRAHGPHHTVAGGG